ncbi:hypothetical protein KY312_00235 [Candidatus Woesearchaeota archaeon]|nr:hypothetical protein [Candidatus Woesearchaeota archaeon]
MEIIFWCEFPEIADWNFIQKIFSQENFKTKVFVACRTRKEFEALKKKIKKNCPNITKVSPWPLLPKKRGYWFSGFTSKEAIDILNEFNKLEIKVDLEPPYPYFNYSIANFVWYGIKKYLKNAKNKEYLRKTIIKLSKDSKIISNEFPFPLFLSKRYGCHMNVLNYKNMSMNYIFYSTFFKHFRFILRAYYKWFSKKAVKEYNDKVMFSLGMLGPGIFGNEPAYCHIDELKKDIEIVKNAGAGKIAIYSIERLKELKNPNKWLKLLKTYL